MEVKFRLQDIRLFDLYPTMPPEITNTKYKLKTFRSSPFIFDCIVPLETCKVNVDQGYFNGISTPLDCMA